MNCKSMEKVLVPYLDGRANSKERALAEAHLKSCAACRERADEFRRLWQVMSEAPSVEPSFAFDARLRQRIAAEPRRKAWSWLVPSPRLAGTVALLAALSIWVSKRPVSPANWTSSQSDSAPANEEQFRMIQDLGVLENYDMLNNFDALSDLPATQPASQTNPAQQNDSGKGIGES